MPIPTVLASWFTNPTGHGVFSRPRNFFTPTRSRSSRELMRSYKSGDTRVNGACQSARGRRRCTFRGQPVPAAAISSLHGERPGRDAEDCGAPAAGDSAWLCGLRRRCQLVGQDGPAQHRTACVARFQGDGVDAAGYSLTMADRWICALKASGRPWRIVAHRLCSAQRARLRRG